MAALMAAELQSSDIVFKLASAARVIHRCFELLIECRAMSREGLAISMALAVAYWYMTDSGAAGGLSVRLAVK